MGMQRLRQLCVWRAGYDVISVCKARRRGLGERKFELG